jgi:hypothetical protein
MSDPNSRQPNAHVRKHDAAGFHSSEAWGRRLMDNRRWISQGDHMRRPTATRKVEGFVKGRLTIRSINRSMCHGFFQPPTLLKKQNYYRGETRRGLKNFPVTEAGLSAIFSGGLWATMLPLDSAFSWGHKHFGNCWGFSNWKQVKFPMRK